jgi:hypothetical protein
MLTRSFFRHRPTQKDTNRNNRTAEITS